MRDLISQGNLSDYRIWAPPQSIDTRDIKVGSTGDFSNPALRKAAHESRIVGDVVQHYMRLAPGKRGITFTVDVEQATEIAAAYNAAGVRAEAVSAKTPDFVRAQAIRKFRDGEILQLVNVDLFGEGFDVPAVEVVSMARPTMSYGLYVQQFGRALRPLAGKDHGIIIDHVGNVRQHGLPDAPRKWTLMADRRGKRDTTADPADAVTACPECFAAYERFRPACPFCGHKPVPQGRSLPEQVDGDLVELDPSVLATLRGDADRIMGDPLVPNGATRVVELSVKKNWRDRREAQEALRENIALWAGMWRDRGHTDSEIYRRFYLSFGIDILSAQALGKTPAGELADKIERNWTDDLDRRQVEGNGDDKPMERLAQATL